MKYRATGVGLLRESRHPIDSLNAPLPTGVDDPGAWRIWLRQVTQCEPFADAMEFASPDLARTVADTLSGSQTDARAVRRAAESVLRYTLRARHRATPFGLFARTVPVRLGKTTAVPVQDEVVVARPDGMWLDAVLDVLHSDLELVERLRVVLDPTCTVTGSRAVVPYVPGTTHPDQVEARATEPMRHVMELAKRPVDVADLADKLHAAYPDVDRSVALTMIAGLVRSRILHSNLRPSAIAPDPLRHLLAVLDAADADTVVGVRPVIAALHDLRTTLDGHLTADPGQRRQLRTRAVSQMTAVAAVERGGLMLDVHGTKPVTIPDSVAQEVSAALSVMARISPGPTGTDVWAAYRREFVDKYSFGTLVPVRDLLDPVAGLGFPAGYQDTLRPAPPAALTSRDEYLLARVQQVMQDGSDEIVLTEQDLAALKVGEPDQVWSSTEATVTLLASTPAALDAEEYTVVVDGMSSSAGVLTGRFLPLLEHDERERFLTSLKSVPTLDHDAVRVQVCAPPLRRRVQNVARSLPVADEVLAVGEHVEGATMHLDELAVGATRSRLYLVHVPTGQRIEPFVMNAVETTVVTHPVIRFLCELPRSHTARLASFAWGAASALPFRPRVRTGRVVLSPATWRLTREDMAAGLEAWRTRWSVPDIVSAGPSDRRLRLDLRLPAHRRLLTGEVEQHGTVTVSEAPDDAGYGWLGRTAQITLPFTAEQDTARAPGRFTGPVPARRSDIRMPGTASASTLLRVDTLPRRGVAVFASGLSEVLDRADLVERWWFTRYNDHAPHLRVRVTLQDQEQFGTLTAKVGDWAGDAVHDGLITGISWTTDRPETGRYGTGQVLDAAEQVFAADSRASLLQDMPGRDPGERDALLAVSLLDIATVMLGEVDGSRFLVDHIERSEGASPPREVRSLARDLAGPDRRQMLRELAAGDDLAEAWYERAAALRSYTAALTSTGGSVPSVLTAILHMHHVRAWGLDSDNEHTIRRLTRATALSILARRSRSTL